MGGGKPPPLPVSGQSGRPPHLLDGRHDDVLHRLLHHHDGLDVFWMRDTAVSSHTHTLIQKHVHAHTHTPCFCSQLTAQPSSSCSILPSSAGSPCSPIRLTSGSVKSLMCWPRICSRGRQRAGHPRLSSVDFHTFYSPPPPPPPHTFSLTPPAHLLVVVQDALQDLLQVADLKTHKHTQRRLSCFRPPPTVGTNEGATWSRLADL